MNAQIFQIFYLPTQADSIDPSFTPYDNTVNLRPAWCEYGIFQKEFKKGTCAENITGFLSWKFNDKTGLNGTQCRNWIENNPGHDVYFINPFGEFIRKKQFKSVWHHGEYNHPGLLPMAQDFMDRAGYGIDLYELIMDKSQTAYCNYWFGTPAFWKRYIDFCDPLYQLIENELTEIEQQKIYQQADPSGCCYIPYMFERLFSTLLCTDENISSCSMLIDKKNRSWSARMLKELTRPLKKIRSYLEEQ
jgi:hypothetical protein